MLGVCNMSLINHYKYKFIKIKMYIVVIYSHYFYPFYLNLIYIHTSNTHLHAVCSFLRVCLDPCILMSENNIE